MVAFPLQKKIKNYYFFFTRKNLPICKYNNVFFRPQKLSIYNFNFNEDQTIFNVLSNKILIS